MASERVRARFLHENIDLASEIESKVRKAMGIGVPELTVIEGGETMPKKNAAFD
jgi:hypothetical protein